MSSILSHHRRSIRLPEYDYSSPGAYFITLVTHQRNLLFGEVTADEVFLAAAGEVVKQLWESLPNKYPQIELDEAVVMPNHFHGILWINETIGAIQSVGAIHELPQQQPSERRSSRRKMLLPLVVGYFKMNSAKRINHILGSQGVPIWQRNYYAHVIRDEHELTEIRKYIQANPIRWESDQENPHLVSRSD